MPRRRQVSGGPDGEDQHAEDKPTTETAAAQGTQPWMPDSIIDSLQSQVVDDENLHVLVGFPATSDRQQAGDDEYRRIYLTPGLDRYVDVLDSHIVHSANVTPADSPVSRVIVWLRSDAVVHYTQRIEAQFLSGDITAELLKTTRAGPSTMPFEPLKPACKPSIQYPYTLGSTCCFVTLCI